MICITEDMLTKLGNVWFCACMKWYMDKYMISYIVGLKGF